MGDAKSPRPNEMIPLCVPSNQSNGLHGYPHCTSGVTRISRSLDTIGRFTRRARERSSGGPRISTSTIRPQIMVEERPRADAIDNHGFDLNLGLWNRQMGKLPGGPVIGSQEETDEGRISSGDLFSLALAASDDVSGVGALRLFWHALVWGTGTAHRNTPGRIQSVDADPTNVGLLLRDAANQAGADPRAAFLLMRPWGNALKHLCPNFFTKFLYFSGGGALDHPCLIVDKRVLTSLHRETKMKVFLPGTTNYGVGVYERALALMQFWARQLSTPDRTVGADEVERWAFATGKFKPEDRSAYSSPLRGAWVPGLDRRSAG